MSMNAFWSATKTVETSNPSAVVLSADLKSITLRVMSSLGEEMLPGEMETKTLGE